MNDETRIEELEWPDECPLEITGMIGQVLSHDRDYGMDR